MRKVLNFVKGRRDDKKGHGSSGISVGPFSELSSPADQPTPTDEHCIGLEQKFGYNVDFTGKDKTITKLHKAAWLGNLEKLKVNMKKTDVNVVDELNRTPLHLAAARGHANIVWFLLGNKANFNICDTEGKTPFLKAVECGHKETIQLMLERGVDINTIDYRGNSGLHIAAKHGFYEIASMLLKQGANFESSNNYGEFPLHVATMAEHKDLIELLLRYGSSVNIVDRDNRSPLMFAAKCGSMALVQLFLEYGAQRSVMDSNDWTAEDYALMGGYHDVAAELKSPSERMVMSFTEKSMEPQRCDTGLASNKRSISDASLPPDQLEHEKEDTHETEGQNEDADNSDTWNDSQLSDSSSKQKGGGLKLTKFLPPSSDDEISEESIQSPQMQEIKDEEVQDSPRSCVIPPPCKPPRSWDLIQSGVIDDPKVMEPRRRSLLPLGSLRTRRESFNESPSTAESPSVHGDGLHVGQSDADQRLGSQSFRTSDDKQASLTHHHLNLSKHEENKDSSSTKYEGIEVKENASRMHKEKNVVCSLLGAGGDGVLDDIRSSKESLKGSSSNSDWDSDDSLPLDNYPVADVTVSPADDSPLKVFRVINPSELRVPDSADDPSSGSPYSLNAEKRGRFLTRAPSIDLTDDDTETGRSKCGHSQKSAELELNKLDTKGGNETDVNSSVSGTLGRDGTLLGYEEVWESNAHIPGSNVALPIPASGGSDTHILVKKELEETLVWNSPKFDVTNKGLTCSDLPKDMSENCNTSEDTLLYPSPRFGKAKSVAVSENDVCTESSKNQTVTGDVYRRNNGLKLESHSLDALEPLKFVPDIKIPRTRKHARQQSISMQSWSRSEELHEKQPSAARIDQMAEENQRINAQLRCYDEALRDLAHVSVVRKQSSLSLPRAKEASSLTRSQSAGARNEGFLSLPLASEVGPREMAQSAIVKKQGSLSLPRTSDIPDFAMVQSLGPKKQGYSSLPCTNDFGTREMAQTAIVKRQGSLSLPRTCEIPDFASASNEEYLSLPRSNELIDEAFKEIGQSSVTMKRGSHSLPRSIDAKFISLGADPIPPPRNKKFSHRRRRAESEGEAFDRRLKDGVDRPISFDVKLQSSNRTEPTAAILNASVENEVATESIHTLNTDEQHCLESTSGSNILKDISVEKPIRKKRKMLLAMRGFLGQNRKSSNVRSVSELSVEGSFDDQPFMMSRDKTGSLERQVTVIERPGSSVKSSDSTTLSPLRLETLEKQELEQQSTVKEHAETLSTQPSCSLLKDVPLFEETASGGQKGDDKVLPDTLQKVSPETQSDDAESGLSYSDSTPQHGYVPKGHHDVLKQHLQKTTAEKGRLEETAAELGDRAEKLKYELAEAHEAARSRDEVIALLEDQLNNLEKLYTKSLEESQRYKLRLGNLEQELKHLKEVCAKHENEKSQLTEIIRLKEIEKINLDKSLTSKDEEKKLQALIGEKQYLQKQQELEVHVNYLEIENHKLKEELYKLEMKNEDLRQKLSAVVARNQVMLEEKAAICARNSVDIEILQDHSKKWSQLYETCVKKLQLLSSCKPSVGSEAHTSEREDLRDKVEQVIQGVEEAKEKSYVILHTKVQEDVLHAVQLLNAVYSKVESLLLKHNKKLESVVYKLLEDLRAPYAKHVPHSESSMEAGTAYTTVKQLEELTSLTIELKEQCQELQQRLEDLRVKSEALKHSSFTTSEEASVTEEELRRENVLLKQEITNLLGDNPRELWLEIKDENTKLKEKIGILLEHVQQEEEQEVTIKSDKRNGTQAQNNELKKQVAELRDQMGKTVGCCDKGIVTDITMITFGKNVGLNEDELGHTACRDLLEQKTVMWEQSPNHAQEIFFELRSENTRLQRQMESLLQHIRQNEDMISKETMTVTMQLPDELLMENKKLKQQITLLMENIKENSVVEQDIMPELPAYELPEQCRDLLNKFKIENTKLTDQLHLFEVQLKEREAKEDRETMTDPLEWKWGQKYDEDGKCKADILFPENKIRQCNKEFNDSGTDFGAVLEDNEAGRTTCCVSKLCSVMSDKCCSNEAFIKNNVQKAFEDKLTDQKDDVVEDMVVENRELKGQLASVRLELEKFHIKTMVHEVQSPKANVHTVQTMTDPDIELVHVSMEIAALRAQLQELTGEYKQKSDDLERTLVLLRETREASSFLLKEARDANAHETTLLKTEFEKMKQKFKNHEQEIYKSRTDTTKEHHPAKITELCNLLDYLRKENIDLQTQLKKMLIEKEHKEEDEYGYHNIQETQETSKDESVGNFDYRVVTNKNLDSLALLISMGYPVSVEEAQNRKTGDIKTNNIDTLDMAMPSQNGSVFSVTNMPAANGDQPKFSIRLDDICKSEQNFGDISLLNKAKQNSPNVESTSQIPIHRNRKKQELQNIESTELLISKYPGTSVQHTGMGCKRDETGCCIFKNKSQNPTLVSHGKIESDDLPSKQTQEDYIQKLQPALAQGSGVMVKHQQMDKDNSSCSSEVILDTTYCHNEMLCGLSSENMNSDLASVSKEPAVRANFRLYRDAATNTTPSIQNSELQRELQLEKDKCRKYQQNVKKLKSDLQFLKNKLGESRKQGKIESNLALKQNNANNNSLLTGMQSPSHYNANMAEFQRQVAELEQKVREESSVRLALEVQVNKMRCELQEKLQVERELDILRNRLEKDFVSRYEMEQLRNSYEMALSRAKYEAEMAARDDLNEKLCQINTFIEKQVQEQTHLSQLRNTTESHMKQDFQETRLKLLSELAKVQASLQAKGEEEKELREKCEKLTRECDKKHEIRRKKLIEKSYNVNLAPNSNLKEKELNSKGYMLDMRSPIHRSSPVQPVINSASSPAVAMTTHIADAWQTDHPFSHILRRELERSIRKHTRTDSLTEHPSTSSPQKSSEEQLELLKKKYFLQ